VSLDKLARYIFVEITLASNRLDLSFLGVVFRGLFLGGRVSALCGGPQSLPAKITCYFEAESRKRTQRQLTRLAGIPVSNDLAPDGCTTR
jgi:hypothetical protein